VIPAIPGRFRAPAHPAILSRLGARLFLPGCLLGLFALLSYGGIAWTAEPVPAPPVKKPPARSLVLITVEGLRPDYLSCYGKGRGKPTPGIDRLAAEGRLFEQVVTSSVSTLPSLATLFTGKTSFEHQVWDDEFRNHLGDQEITLAEQLKAKGYRTAAFLGSSRAAVGRGFDQGFEIYQDGYVRPSNGTWILKLRSAQAVSTGAQSWLEGVGEAPFFLWLHFVDPIVPGQGTPELPSKELEKTYLEHLAFLDVQLGLLFESLKQRKDYQSLTIALTADHGFGVGEHGESRAGVFLYEPTLRIPLILRAPGANQAKGSRVSELAGSIDLYPTLARLMDIPPIPGLSGRDLLGQAPVSPRSFYASALFGRETFGWAGVEGLAQGKWRLILGPPTELYDVAADPGETKNLSSSLPGEVSRLKDALRQVNRGETIPRAHFQVGPAPATAAVTRITEMGMIPPTLEKARARPLPDPAKFRDSLLLLEEMALRWEVLGNAAFSKARESLLKADPQARLTLLGVGAIDIPEGEEGVKKAKELLRTAQQLFPLESEVYHQLGHLAFPEKRFGDAIFLLELSLGLQPVYPGEIVYDLACAYARKGDKAGALKQLREAVRLGFRDAKFIGSDPDLESLRGDAGYKKLMEEDFQAPLKP
jgi:Arylsulfatase A and related enzymes